MPKKDRTFSDKDIIRITIRNLERQEKVRVLRFFAGEDLPPESPKPNKQRKEATRVQKEVNRVEGAVRQVLSVLDPIALIPGPQRPLLREISAILNDSLTVFGIISIFIGGKESE